MKYVCEVLTSVFKYCVKPCNCLQPVRHEIQVIFLLRIFHSCLEILKIEDKSPKSCME